MGSENLFHKRRERKATNLARKNKHRQQQPRILIVCEDSKSSAYYFEDMAKERGLKAVDVRGKECGSAPISVVTYALQVYAAETDSDTYDGVYCVFDRDQHGSFDLAIRRISESQNSGKPFFAITSIPCFEIWLLLHFQDAAKPFTPAANRSACDQVVSELRKKVPLRDYKKGRVGICALLSNSQMREAILRAKRIAEDNKKTGSDNPSTNVYELVEYLHSIAPTS
jgi:RloB-like protein